MCFSDFRQFSAKTKPQAHWRKGLEFKITLTYRANDLEGSRIQFSKDKCKTLYLIRNEPLYQYKTISLNSSATEKRAMIDHRLNTGQLCHVAAKEANVILTPTEKWCL